MAVDRRSRPSRPASASSRSRSAARRSTDAKTYTLATNDFMAGGGDGYAVFKAAKQLIDPADATLMASQVIDYIAAKGTDRPGARGPHRHRVAWAVDRKSRRLRAAGLAIKSLVKSPEGTPWPYRDAIS